MARSTRIDHSVDHLLPSWGAWARRENHATGLGYSRVQYAELIARSTSASDYHSTDPDILRLDKIIRTRLATESMAIVRWRYEYQLPDKAIAARLKLSRPTVNQMLHRIVLPQLRLEWDAAVGTARGFETV